MESANRFALLPIEGEDSPTPRRSLVRRAQDFVASSRWIPSGLYANLAAQARRQNPDTGISTAQAVGTLIGAALPSTRAFKLKIQERAQQVLANQEVDTMVCEWKMQTNTQKPEAVWALRLRDEFGVVSPSEAARLTGERWVSEQIRERDAKEGVTRPEGVRSKIAFAASTLWLTPDVRTKAWHRHQQGFRSGR